MLKQIKWSYILSSAAFIFAGVLMIIYPNVTAQVVANILGIAALVYAGINLLGYFMMDVRDTLHNNSFVTGLISAIVGVLILTRRDVLADLIPIILGMVIVLSGFMKLQQGIVARRIGFHSAGIYVVMAAISIVFGIVIMFFMNGEKMADILFIVIGVGLVYCGVTDLISNLFLASKFNSFLRSFEKKKEMEGKVIDAQAETISSEKEESQNPEDGNAA